MGQIFRQRKIYISALFLLLPFFSPPISAADEDVSLRIPIRAYLHDQQVEGFDKSQFSLFLNNRPREIEEMIPRRRSIGEISPLGRNFILSFFADKYDALIARGFSYFLERVFMDNDRLLLITPLGQYEIKGSRNRQKMLQRLEDLLERDCHKYRKRKFAHERNLLLDIRHIRERSTSSLVPLLNHTPSPHELPKDLSALPAELSIFQKRFIYPPYERLRLILKEWPSRGGETFWIHFHTRQTSQALSQTKSLLDYLRNRLRAFFADRSLTQGMEAIQRELRMPAPDSLYLFLDALQRRNVCFFTVLTGNLPVSRPGSNLGTDTMLVKNFQLLTRSAGGLMVASTQPLADWARIIDHRDIYYELTCVVQTMEAMNAVHIEIPDPQTELCYRREFLREEIFGGHGHPVCTSPKIDNLHTTEEALAFSISRFRTRVKERYGLLKVKVAMRDSRNTLVYGNEKTLRTYRDPVNISLVFTTPKRGDFTVTISVYDLLANSRTDLRETLRPEAPALRPE